MILVAVTALLPERYRSTHLAQRRGYVTAPSTRPMGRGIELWARRKNGTEFRVDIMLSPVAVAGENLVLAVIRELLEPPAP